MSRAERRAAQVTERERKEELKQRPRGLKQPIADRLRKFDTNELLIEGFTNENCFADMPHTAADIRSPEGGRVMFQQLYNDVVVDYGGPHGNPRLEITRHVTPSDRVLEFGIKLAGQLRQGEWATLKPKDDGKHEIVTDDPDRLVAYLLEAGAVVAADGEEDIAFSLPVD